MSDFPTERIHVDFRVEWTQAPLPGSYQTVISGRLVYATIRHHSYVMIDVFPHKLSSDPPIATLRLVGQAAAAWREMAVTAAYLIDQKGKS